MGKDFRAAQAPKPCSSRGRNPASPRSNEAALAYLAVSGGRRTVWPAAAQDISREVPGRRPGHGLLSASAVRQGVEAAFDAEPGHLPLAREAGPGMAEARNPFCPRRRPLYLCQAHPPPGVEGSQRTPRPPQPKPPTWRRPPPRKSPGLMSIASHVLRTNPKHLRASVKECGPSGGDGACKCLPGKGLRRCWWRRIFRVSCAARKRNTEKTSAGHSRTVARGFIPRVFLTRGTRPCATCKTCANPFDFLNFCGMFIS
jgi:hypothetical protein